MSRVVTACFATLLIMFVVPFPFYAGFQALELVEMPEGASTAQFMISVIVMKIGVAVGFVLLFRLLAGDPADTRWRYAAIWWLMFAVVEIGQAIGPNYGWGEAVAGIIAEASYFPLSALLVSRLLPRAQVAT